MHDPRVDRLAEILVSYSTGVQPGEVVQISGDELGKPLILAIYEEVLKAGGHPILRIRFPEANKIFFDHASEAQLGYQSPVLKYLAEQTDVYIGVEAPTNLKALTQVDPQKQVKSGQANRPIMDTLINKRWVGCQYPTAALAQEAELSLDEFEDFVYGATNIDWPATKSKLSELKQRLEGAREIRIIARDTDLRLEIGGRIWQPGDGTHNMPDGEIFTGPIEDSAEGHISYDLPAIYREREVDGVSLEFRAGKIVNAAAKKGEDYLLMILDADEGARRLGEIGIGTNYGISRFTRNILFDEKIGGSVHLAVGRSYEKTGGKNSSSVHWDMIRDLRSGGSILLDGQPFQVNGEFID